MVSEREVRKVAGWIGVEISRSRVRRADRPGYGLWRVRGWVPEGPDLVVQSGPHAGAGVRVKEGPGLWTGYLFTLTDIDAAVRNAIEQGQPSGPLDLHLPIAGVMLPGSFDPETIASRPTGVVVPTRWTSRYQGRRDLGEVGMGELPAAASSVRSRRREYNEAFAAEHAVRRGHGLQARHAAKTQEHLKSASGSAADGFSGPGA